MGKVLVVELEAKTGKAEKNLQDVANAFDELNKEVTKTNKNTVSGLKDTEKGLESVSNGAKSTSKGLKGISTAWKAIGFGAILGILKKFGDLLMENQQIANTVNAVFEAMGIVVKQITTAFANTFKRVSEATGGFDALGKVLGGALTIAINSVVGVVQGLVLGVKKAQLAWEESFFGDKDPETIKRLQTDIEEVGNKLDETGNKIKNGGKQIADNFGEAISEVGELATGVTKAVSNSIKEIDVKSALADGKRLVASKNNFERLAQQQQRLVEQYDLQAERLRQIRDDESKSTEERIKANDELGQVLLEQNAAEKKTVQARIDALLLEQRLKGKSIELSNEIFELQTEMLAIDAKVAGFESEQQTNKNSLLREEVDLKNELALIGKTESEREIADATAEYEAKKLLIEQQITDETERKRYLEALEKEHLTNVQTIKDEAQAEEDEKDRERKEKKAEENAEIVQKEIELEKSRVEAKEQALDQISNIFGAESNMGKAALIAKQLLAAKEMLIDLGVIKSKATKTIVTANMDAAKSGTAIATGAAETAKIGFPQNIPMLIGYAATAAGIFSSIKSALSTTKNVAGKYGSGGGSANLLNPPTATASVPPAFNVVGASDTNQLADAIGGQSQEPVRAFVVSNDVTTAQSMDRNIVDGASI